MNYVPIVAKAKKHESAFTMYVKKTFVPEKNVKEREKSVQSKRKRL